MQGITYHSNGGGVFGYLFSRDEAVTDYYSKISDMLKILVTIPAPSPSV